MSNDCGVYALLNTRTGKVYVGSSVDVARRYDDHMRCLRGNRHHNAYLQRAWQQYTNSFAVALIDSCELSNLRACECYWIQELQAADPSCGYNLASAVADRFVTSPETRAKQRAAKSNTTSETRDRMSAAHRGKSPHNKGQSASIETRTKQSISQKARFATTPISQEICARMAEARRGLTRSPETRARMAIAQQAYHARKRAERAQQEGTYVDCETD